MRFNISPGSKASEISVLCEPAMPKPLSCLFVALALALEGGAQCGYPVTLHTNKDYCVGSSLIVNTSHALQNIVWYKDGQPVASATGSQACDTSGISLPVQPPADISSFISDIASDDTGNLYIYYSTQVLKYTPGHGYGLPLVSGVYYWGSLVLDQQGNIYTLLTAGSGYEDSALVTEYLTDSPSSPSAVTSRTAVPRQQQLTDNYGVAGSLFLDCRHNIYVYFPGNQLVVKWPAGSATGVIVAGQNTYIPQCFPAGAMGRVRVDLSGNIFYMVGQAVVKMVPGASGPVPVTTGGCIDNYTTRAGTDFYIDAGDTVYLCGYDGHANSFYVDKWAPGAAAAQTILTHAQTYPPNGDRISMNMDVKGNIFLGFVNSNSLLEFRRRSTIDSAYTPPDTGSYYAVVTDIQGYTSVSDTFRVNSPAPPPSIQINATATNTPVCTPITFTATVTNVGYDPSFQWMVSGVPAGGDSAEYSYNLFANGDQVYCILRTQAGCEGPVADTSNILALTIDPQGAASVTIASPKDTICQGDTAVFIATVANASANPTFEWLVNGKNTGDDGPDYSSSHFSNGDILTCLITSDDVCGLAKSNSIPVSVDVPPKVEGGQLYTILRGQSVTLTPVITAVAGTDTYSWSPPVALSDPAVPNPIADPTSNTLYTLKVSAPGGCWDTASVFVNVYTPVRLPEAFTPNGDGHNDVFYVLGGPINSRITDFAVYNRFGTEVFAVHGGTPGDPRFGWNGSFHSSPAPAGTYVYFIEMQFADGSRQSYKGTIILIR